MEGEKFYIYFYREGEDDHLCLATKDLFREIFPFKEELDMGWSVPQKIMDLAVSLLDLPHQDLSGKEMDSIPDDNFIRVTLF